MKRGISLVILFVLILSVYSVSAEILITQQPKEVYNLGDVITVPSIIKTSNDVTGVFKMSLLCNGLTDEFYVNGVSLSAGEEKRFEASLVLTKEVIGELKGDCKIKASIGEEFKLTPDFEISDALKINIEFDKTNFNPGEKIDLQGSAVKENGEDADGYIQLNIKEANVTKISQSESIDNGFFSVSTTLPKDMPAGEYTLVLEGYEQDSKGVKTNTGSSSKTIKVNQIPTNLEVFFENPDVEPGKSFKVKPILHDQTGEKIYNKTSFLTIKDQNDKILDQKEVMTDELVEYNVPYNEPPQKWKAVAISSKLTGEAQIEILEKEATNVKIINKTLIIKNTGNVPYNKTVLVKVGNETLNIPVYLKIDEEKKYTLSAPDGKYHVEVLLEGNETLSGDVLLTGKSINVKEASSVAGNLIHYPIVWIFLIAILGFVSFIVFKRTHQQSFLGYMGSKVKRRHGKKFQNSEGTALNKNALVNSKSPAHLSLSIQGKKQSSVLLGLHIKNLSKLQSQKGEARNTLQQIVDLAEKEKASTYEAGPHLIFIFAPIRTRTFKNGETALKTATQINRILKDHNRKFKDSIDYGIALTQGEVVAKETTDTRSGRTLLYFMSLGNLVPSTKKISSHSKEEILIDKNTNEKLKDHVKTEKHGNSGNIYYSIKEIKNAEDNKRFLRSFLDRLEHGDKKGSDSEKPIDKKE